MPQTSVEFSGVQLHKYRFSSKKEKFEESSKLDLFSLFLLEHVKKRQKQLQ